MKKSIIAISLASIFLVACNKAEKPKTEEHTPPATTEATSETVIDSEHTAENSLGTGMAHIKVCSLVLTVRVLKPSLS